MTQLALCMVIKDEVNHIAGCLEPIIDLLDSVVIIDTGSTDGTQDLLKQKFGITPLSGKLTADRCFCKSDVRNAAFENVETPWILSLDADERIGRDALERFLRMRHPESTMGYFGTWVNHVDGAQPFEDYKLFLFRKGARKRGLIHENVQVDIRSRNQRAAWLDGLSVQHYPERSKHATKTAFYRQRLECALRNEPDWYRYYWFLGYMDYCARHWDEALAHLDKAASSNSPLFPVECLNSCMVMAEIYAQLGQQRELAHTLDQALAFYRELRGDFEVQINRRLLPWFTVAREHCRKGELESIKAYRFAR